MKVIAEISKSPFIPKGFDTSALDGDKKWHFKKSNKLKVGSMLTGGDILGTCFENNLFDEHKILLPPKAKGKIVEIYPDGDYNVNESILELEFDGKVHKYSMSHKWPVRQPRPF